MEERGGALYGYEFKWQGEMKSATRREFTLAYPGAYLTTITPDNFEPFVSE